MKLTRHKISKLRNVKNQSYKSVMKRKKKRASSIRTTAKKEMKHGSLQSGEFRKERSYMKTLKAVISAAIKISKRGKGRRRRARGGAGATAAGASPASLGPPVKGDITLGSMEIKHVVGGTGTEKFLRDVIKNARGKVIQIKSGAGNVSIFSNDVFTFDSLLYGTLAPEGVCKSDEKNGGKPPKKSPLTREEDKELYYCPGDQVGVCGPMAGTNKNDAPPGAYIYIPDRNMVVSKSNMPGASLIALDNPAQPGSAGIKAEVGQVYKIRKGEADPMDSQLFETLTTSKVTLKDVRLRIAPVTEIKPGIAGQGVGKTMYVYNMLDGVTVRVIHTLKTSLETVRINLADKDDDVKEKAVGALRNILNVAKDPKTKQDFKQKIYEFSYLFTPDKRYGTKNMIDEVRKSDMDKLKELVIKIEKALGYGTAGPGGECEVFPNEPNQELRLLITDVGEGGVTVKLENGAEDEKSVLGTVKGLVDLLNKKAVVDQDDADARMAALRSELSGESPPASSPASPAAPEQTSPQEEPAASSPSPSPVNQNSNRKNSLRNATASLENAASSRLSNASSGLSNASSRASTSLGKATAGLGAAAVGLGAAAAEKMRSRTSSPTPAQTTEPSTKPPASPSKMELMAQKAAESARAKREAMKAKVDAKTAELREKAAAKGAEIGNKALSMGMNKFAQLKEKGMGAIAQATGTTPPAPSPLPAGWTEKKDANDHTYYEHNATKNVYWHRPTTSELPQGESQADIAMEKIHPITADQLQKEKALIGGLYKGMPQIGASSKRGRLVSDRKMVSNALVKLYTIVNEIADKVLKSPAKYQKGVSYIGVGITESDSKEYKDDKEKYSSAFKKLKEDIDQPSGNLMTAFKNKTSLVGTSYKDKYDLKKEEPATLDALFNVPNNLYNYYSSIESLYESVIDNRKDRTRLSGKQSEVQRTLAEVTKLNQINNELAKEFGQMTNTKTSFEEFEKKQATATATETATPPPQTTSPTTTKGGRKTKRRDASKKSITRRRR